MTIPIRIATELHRNPPIKYTNKIFICGQTDMHYFVFTVPIYILIIQLKAEARYSAELFCVLFLANNPLLQVFSEIHTERSQFVGGHDGAYSSLELALGIELLELGKICSKILARKLLGVGTDPLVPQSHGGIVSFVGVHTEKVADQVLSVVRHLSPVFFVEFVLSLANLAEKSSLVGLDERRVSSQQNVHDDTDGPHICLGIVGFAFQNFCGDVPGLQKAIIMVLSDQSNTKMKKMVCVCVKR